MGRNWSRKSIEEIAKQVAKGIKGGNPSVTVRGAREWGYPVGGSSDNQPWAEGYFMDIEMVKSSVDDGYSELVTMYLPLPIFNGSINPNGFVDKGITGVSYDYDPIKGQLAFIYNDGCEPTIYKPSDDNLLYRGLAAHNGQWWRPLNKLPKRNDAMSWPDYTWEGTVTLYKATLKLEPKVYKGEIVVKLGEVIVERDRPKLSEFSVFRDSYAVDPWNVYDSNFYPSVKVQEEGYSNQALQYLDAPKTDEWKHYNLTGTTYAFNTDKNDSIAMTGRGLPAAAVSSFSNNSSLTHKIFVAGTLLNDLLFNQEYDVLKKDNNNNDYVSESAVLKISFKL